MFFMICFFLASMTLIFLIKLLSYFASEHTFLNREELSSYECGFEHHGLSRIPFSLRYFFLTLIFLLFDLEIVLVFLFPLNFSVNFLNFSVIVCFIFLFFLFLGLLYEWKEGSLDWIL